MLPGQFLRYTFQGYMTLNFHYSQFIRIKRYSAYQTDISLKYMIRIMFPIRIGNLGRKDTLYTQLS